MKPSENLNPLSTNPQNGQTHSKCLSVFGNFVILTLKSLSFLMISGGTEVN